MCSSDLAGDQPQQGGLTRTVWSHERCDGAVADAKRNVVEQPPSIREHVADVADFDMAHTGKYGNEPGGDATRFRR